MKKMLTLLLMLGIGVMPVNAACNYTDKAAANKKAANVKLDYEVVEDTQEYDDGTISVSEYFKMTILNVTEDLYVTVTNDVTNTTNTYRYSDVKDGVITFNWDNNEVITNFTMKVYGSDSSPCKDEELRTIRKQTPRYNDFANRAICEDMKDFYLCEKYTTVENIDESMFINKVTDYAEGKIDDNGENKDDKKDKNILYYLNEYKWYIMGGLLVIALGSGIAIVIRNKKYREVK